jgi:hypothetical protein
MTTRSGSRQLFARPAARPIRQAPAWFRALTIGFGLGGGLLGTGGGLLGVGMPYHYPVAVAISVLWWGIYLGCFGGECRRSDCLVYQGCSGSWRPGSRWPRFLDGAGNDTGRLFGSAGRAG